MGCTEPPAVDLAPTSPLLPPPTPTAVPAPPITTVPQAQASGGCPGGDADFMVIDTRNADDPRAVARIRLPGDGELGGAVVRDTTVFVAQVEMDGQAPNGRELLRYYTSEIRLDDPAKPVVGARVNVPGVLIGERAADGTWFTVEPMVDAQGRQAGMVVNALYRPTGSSKAHLERQLRLEGVASGPVSDGRTLYFAIDGQLVSVDLAASDAPKILSRTPIAGATTSGDPSASAGLLNDTPQASAPMLPAVPANVHQVVHGHLFVMLGARLMLIYDVRDPTRPRLLDRIVVSPRGASPVRAAPDNRAMIPRAEWGVDVVELPL